MKFFVGLDHAHHAGNFPRACVSINTLRRRRSAFPARDWIMDSGAFTELFRHGRYRHGVEEYAAAARRWLGVGRLEAIVAQDFMCEPFILARTGLSVAEHQRLTIERFDGLVPLLPGVYVMPVIQGFAPAEYAAHVRAYGDRLAPGAWCGVGSVCKRNAAPEQILAVLDAIGAVRPDLKLHGFGVKATALAHPGIRAALWSADSMAWSFAARKQGRDCHDWREAAAFAARIEALARRPPMPWQLLLPGL